MTLEQQTESSLDEQIEEFFASQKHEEAIPSADVYGRRILEKAEGAYFEHLNIYEEKQKEKQAVKDKIALKKKKLSNCKNIKNVKKAGLNKERSKKRKKLKAEIAELQMTLDDMEGADKKTE